MHTQGATKWQERRRGPVKPVSFQSKEDSGHAGEEPQGLEQRGRGGAGRGGSWWFQNSRSNKPGWFSWSVAGGQSETVFSFQTNITVFSVWFLSLDVQAQ